MVQLEENLHRKDLTAAERSKTYDALRKSVEKRLLENASSIEPQGQGGNSSTVVEKVGHRRQKREALDHVAEEIGVSRSTIS